MKPRYVNGNVIARCPDCSPATTTFERQHGGSGFGSIVVDGEHEFEGGRFNRVIYQMMRCAACGRGGIAQIHCRESVERGKLESFFPYSVDHADIPEAVPEEIESEFREAEICASFGAKRAASALFRSTLEKTLKANGYVDGGLQKKIDDATADGVITEARRKRAHEEIRVLGNDVLHDEWREIDEDEVEDSHRYVHRILEDFYDDRASVEDILVQKGRIQPTENSNEGDVNEQ